MEQKIKNLILESERYCKFILLEEPKKFSELFKDYDYDFVDVHTIDTYTYNGKEYLTGFCGSFSWKNNILESLDGDSYNKDMLVYGYDEFTADGENVVDILVGNDW